MDTFTLAAQVLNFLVLVALLRRFLYGPILRVMEERERRLERVRAEGEAALVEARRLADEAVAEARRLDEARAAMLAQAERDAAEHRHRLLDSARREVAEREREWKEDLRRSQDSALRELRPRLAAALENACRRALEDLAGVDLEDRMALRLAERLPPGAIEVTSSRPLGEAAEARLSQGRTVLRFQTRAGPPGVTVRVGGEEFSWTLDSYLEALEVRVRALIEEERRLAGAAPG